MDAVGAARETASRCGRLQRTREAVLKDKRYTSSRWRRLRKTILERDGFVCQIQLPGCKLRADQVDHILPVEDGGDFYEPDNLRAACGRCNTTRANKQKTQAGWLRSSTRIVLVVGPPAAGKTTWALSKATENDVVIDYDALAAALGPMSAHGATRSRHETTMKLRNLLIRETQRGELRDVDRVFLLSTNPNAEAQFPHHEVEVVDPGREVVEERVKRDRPDEFWELVDRWYTSRSDDSSGERVW